MPDLDHEPVEITEWKGLYSRGDSDGVPPGYFIDTLNTKFVGSDVTSRDGYAAFLILSPPATQVVRFFSYKTLTGGQRYIILRTNGDLEDTIAVATPIISDATFLDFSMVNYGGRAYITPHNRTTGISGKSLLVYLGSGSARVAAGTPPSGYVMAAVESGTAGNVEAGVHLVAIVNISDTGFISAPALYIAVTSTGGKKIDVSNIDAGPSGTIQRGVVATKAIQNYNGNPLGYEYFIVPSANGGLVNNNNNNETAALSFFDDELKTSADYLFDNRSTIPAGVGITEYKGRLVTWGILGDEHSVYLSKPFQPEQFDSIGGIITVDPFESHSGVKNCFAFRGSLVICKGNRIYQTTDNDGDPSTWPVDLIDNGAGTECFGVGTVIDSKGQENDRAFIADRSGLLIFEGYVKRPEATWLIEDTWKRINKAVFNLIQVCTDPLISSLFVSLPLDGDVAISHILYGYYGEAIGPYGLDPIKIKWSLWQIPGSIPRSILIDIDTTTLDSVFMTLGPGVINQIKHDGSVHSDGAGAISFDSFVKTALYSVKSGWVNHFAGIKLKIEGSGNPAISLFGEDDVDTQVLTNSLSPPLLTLSTAPGKEFFVPANFKNEKASIKIGFSGILGSYFKLSRAILYAKPLWFTRPA